MKRGFLSGFASDLNGMLDLKVSLGYSEQSLLGRSRQFDVFCADNHAGIDLVTEPLAVSWLRFDSGLSASVIHSRAAFLRALACYQKAIGKAAYVLPDAYISGRQIFVPYLFTDSELTALFSEIDQYTYARNPFQPILLSTYFRLTYTCGLRPGEGRNLKYHDVDLDNGEIRIVNTKWHKSRTVVMSDDMCSLARKYAPLRDAAYPESDYFFPSAKGGSISAQWMQTKFRLFYARSRPDIPEDLLPAVRVYDLRHRFATTVLNNWLNEKRDLSSRLPYLQTYMGHKELAATAYYIHLLPEQLVKNAGIDWESMNQILPRYELWEK